MAEMSYARAKGREPAPVPAKLPAVAPSKPLSEAERARVAENYALLKTHLPELVPLVKELHAEGLIDGLRAVQNVRVFNGKDA